MKWVVERRLAIIAGNIPELFGLTHPSKEITRSERGWRRKAFRAEDGGCDGDRRWRLAVRGATIVFAFV